MNAHETLVALTLNLAALKQQAALPPPHPSRAATVELARIHANLATCERALAECRRLLSGAN